MLQRWKYICDKQKKKKKYIMAKCEYKYMILFRYFEVMHKF